MKNYYEFESEKELAQYCLMHVEAIPEKIGIGRGWTEIYKLLDKEVEESGSFKRVNLYYYHEYTRLIISYIISHKMYELYDFIKQINLNGKIKNVYTTEQLKIYLSIEEQRKIDKMFLEITEGV